MCLQIGVDAVLGELQRPVDEAMIRSAAMADISIVSRSPRTRNRVKAAT